VGLESLAGKVNFINVLATVLHQSFNSDNGLVRLAVKSYAYIYFLTHSGGVSGGFYPLMVKKSKI